MGIARQKQMKVNPFLLAFTYTTWRWKVAWVFFLFMQNPFFFLLQVQSTDIKFRPDA